MNQHINELPEQIARMLFVIENTGLRISDLCNLKTNCIKKNSNDEFVLTYYQSKSKKYNVIPINEIVGLTIEKAVETSRREFGQECQYVFSKSKCLPISQDTFSRKINEMSKKNNIKDDNGKPLRIKSHTFRGTVATKYANLGIDPNIIMMMLGQSSLGVLKHYITIHDINMINALEMITKENDKLISQIGNFQEKQFDQNMDGIATPLPNGCCTKSINAGVCDHANACYTCRMFKPSVEILPIYKIQLKDVLTNIQIAEINGFERILEINMRLKESLQNIISGLEKENLKNE